MAVPSKCAIWSQEKQNEKVSSPRWHLAVWLFWNQSDFLLQEFSWLRTANYFYQRAWKTPEMEAFKKFYYSSNQELLWANVDKGNLMKEAYIIYTNDGKKNEKELEDFIAKNSTELNDNHKQYIIALDKALQSFIEVMQNPNVSEEVTRIIGYIINNKIKDQSKEWWWELNAFFSKSDGWEKENNILSMLSLRWSEDAQDSDGNRVIKLDNIISNNDTVFKDTIEKLLWESSRWSLYENPGIVRNAILNLIWYTPPEVWKRVVWKYAIINAAWMLWKFWVNSFVWGMMAIASFVPSYFTQSLYRRFQKRTNEELESILYDTGIWTDWDTGETFASGNWLQRMWNKLWNFSGINIWWNRFFDLRWLWSSWYQRWWFIDQTGKLWVFSKFQNTWFGRAILSGIPNIVWDWMFRKWYFMIAMDRAMNKLWWTGPASKYLKKLNINTGKYETNKENVLTLNDEFMLQLAHLLGTSKIEWGTQTTRWWYYKMYSFMTQWATRYVNNNLDIMIWWSLYQINKALSKKIILEEDRPNATATDLFFEKYWLPMNDKLMRSYTVNLENWYNNIEWMIAQDIYSKEETINSLLMVADAFQIAAMIWTSNSNCRNQEWELDFGCVLKSLIGIVSLPWLALQMGHPLVKATIWIMTDPLLRDINPFISDDSPEAQLYEDNSIYERMALAVANNYIAPFLRILSFANTFVFNPIKWSFNDEWTITPQIFLEHLKESIIRWSRGILFYTQDNYESFVAPWAYTPKSLINNSLAIFWNYNLWYKDKAGEALDFENKMNKYSARQLLFSTLWWIWKIFYNWEKFWDNDAEKAINILRNDEGIMQKMMSGELPDDAKWDENLRQYMWNVLTKNRKSWWAIYPDWVRNNIDKDGNIQRYNEKEIAYAENILKEAGWAGAIDKALEKTLSPDLYKRTKTIVEALSNNWQVEESVYQDWLWHMQSDSRMSGVMWLALTAEYLKRIKLAEAWISPYTKREERKAWEKVQINAIQWDIAETLAPALNYVDRWEWYNIIWKYATNKYPELAKMDYFKWLLKTKDWTKEDTLEDLRTNTRHGSFHTAMRSWYLANSEIARGNINWFELYNTITEKLWSPYSWEWENRKFDSKKASELTNTIIYLNESMKDLWKSDTERINLFIPTLTQNIEVRDNMRKDKDLINAIWDDKKDYIDAFLYEARKAVKWLPELLETVKDNISLLWNKSYWYKWWWYSWWSNYYWKSPQKDYDLYKQFYPKFLERWSNNLSRLSTAYAKWSWTNYNNAWNYSSREYAYLNSRARWNPLISQRIAPDVQFSGGWFTRKSVKVSLAYWSGWAGGIKTKNAKFVENKTVARWEWFDRQLSDNRIKRYNNVSNKSKSKNGAARSRLPNNIRSSKVSS